MLDRAHAPSDLASCLQFHTVALAVVEGKRVAIEAIAPGNAEAGGGIESPA
jgi:hypothetical protein